MAEACAARFAINMALEKGWTNIHLEGDCLQVDNAFKDGGASGMRPFEVIIAASIDLATRFSSFSVSFIRRSSNCLAMLSRILRLMTLPLSKGFLFQPTWPF